MSVIAADTMDVALKDAAVVGAADIQDPVKPSKLSRSMTSTSIPDSSIPLKKLIHALLAISLGTCELLLDEKVDLVYYSLVPYYRSCLACQRSLSV
jgi:hypothetical protein